MRIARAGHPVDNDHASDNGDATSGHADDDPNDTLLNSTVDSFQKGACLKRAPFLFRRRGIAVEVITDAPPQENGDTLKVLRAANKILAGRRAEG